MKKPIVKVILYLLFPIAVTLIASNFKNTFVTLGAFIVSILILAIILRADLFMLIGTFTYSKNKEKGLKWMKNAMDTGKLRAKSCLLYAYVLLRNGSLDEAESIINKTTYLARDILKDADRKNAEFNLALIDWKRGDLTTALTKTEELYNSGYLNSNVYATLGYFYIANNETERAIEISKEGTLYNSDDLATLDNLGQAYIVIGELDEAQKVYDKLLEKNPQFLEPYYNYATLLEKRTELSQAAEYYKMALDYDEKFLSTITHEQVYEAIRNLEEIMK